MTIEKDIAVGLILGAAKVSGMAHNKTGEEHILVGTDKQLVLFALKLKEGPPKPAQEASLRFEEGYRATVWHEGSKSFYEAYIIRPMTAEEVANEIDEPDHEPT